MLCPLLCKELLCIIVGKSLLAHKFDIYLVVSIMIAILPFHPGYFRTVQIHERQLPRLRGVRDFMMLEKILYKCSEADIFRY